MKTKRLTLPGLDENGYYPAQEAMAVSLARDIIRSRRRLGLTQLELAARAGIRPETLNRIEQGKHPPSPRTVDKIDLALKKADAKEKAKGKEKVNGSRN